MVQEDISDEIEAIKSLIARHFPVYDVRVSYESLSFFVSVDRETLDEDFDSMRRKLMDEGYIPSIRTQMGEHIINVIRKPDIQTRSIWINRILLIVTTFTTIFAGAFLWQSYMGVGELFTVDNFLWGALFFALPLMTILGAHELSHYLMSKRHGVDASLPFFIPSIPPLGTFGAFISMRDPMPDRKALLDIGVAGPIAGLLVTLPVTVLGLFLTAQGNMQTGALGPEGGLGLMLQPLFHVFMLFMPIPEGAALHPTAFAAWVGFLVTAINLLPTGQLDGGHIARAFFGEKTKYLSYATAGILVIMSFWFTGWIFFAIIIFFLGLKHPPPLNDISRVGLKRKVVGALAIVILISTFVPVPVSQVSPDYSFSVQFDGGNNTTATPGEVVYFNMTVNNTGNSNLQMHMSAQDVPTGWGAVVYLSNSPSINSTNTLNFDVPYEERANITLEIVVAEESLAGEKIISLHTESQDTSRSYHFTVDVNYG